MQEADNFDWNYSFKNPYTTQPKKGEYSADRCFLDAFSKEKRRLWILLTTVRLKNVNEYDNYTPASLVTLKKVSAAMRNPVIDSSGFKALLLKILDIVKWRDGLGMETIVVLEPPKLEYLAGWERIFAEHGIKIAWVDENDCAVIPVYSPAKQRKKDSHSEDNFLKHALLTIENLAEGESFKLDIGTSTLVKNVKPLMENAWWDRRIGSPKYSNSDTLKKWIVRVNRVGKTKFDSNTRFEVLYSRQTPQNFIVIRRRTAEEEAERKNPNKRPPPRVKSKGEIFV